MSSPEWLDSCTRELVGSGRQEAFVAKLRTNIQTCVEGQGKDCIAIVEEDGYGANVDRIHRVGLDTYLIVIGCFCAGSTYRGHSLQPHVVKPLLDLFMTSVRKFIEDNKTLIGGQMINRRVDQLLGRTSSITPLEPRRTTRGGGYVDGNELSKMLTTMIDLAVSAATSDMAGTAKTLFGFLGFNAERYPKVLGRRLGVLIGDAVDQALQGVSQEFLGDGSEGSGLSAKAVDLQFFQAMSA